MICNVNPTEKSIFDFVKLWLILQLPDRSSSESDRKKIKLLGDPLDDIKHYLGLEEIRSNSSKSRHEEKRRRESEHSHTRRTNKESKKKTHKHVSKKRLHRKDSSTNSGRDTSTEVSKLLSLSFHSDKTLQNLKSSVVSRRQKKSVFQEPPLPHHQGYYGHGDDSQNVGFF
jgi:hypothetical protein